MKGILEALHNFGIEIGYGIAGLIGGLITMNTPKNKKRPIWEKVVIVLVGIACANYLTPLVIWLCHVPEGVQYGISFVIGYMGLNGLGYLIDILRDKERKFSKRARK